MSTDPNKKSMRTFQCRDVLWESFEQLAGELECSVDYLVNESMKQYLRQRQQGPRTPFPGTTTENPVVTGTLRPLAAPPAIRPARPAPPPSMPPPMPPAPPQARMFPTPPPPSEAMSSPPPPRSPAVQPGSSTPVLVVHYAGQVVPVTKDRFIIGRGKHATDLRLADPNVSRQHAMVELTADGAAIVDLDSTNGVEFNGERVKRRAIQNGDLFVLCGHELRFEYQWSSG